MKTRNYHFIFLVLLLIGFTSCNSSKETEITPIVLNENSIEITIAQFENSKMKLGKVSMQTFNEGIKTNGYIDVPPANRAKVSAIMGGYIKKSQLLVGDKVKKGQLLLTIENPEFIEVQQKYLEIYERLSYLKSEKERQKILFEEKISSQKNYLKAESDYKSSLAQLNGLGKKLQMMNINLSNVKEGNITSTISIFAPISGSISNIYTSIGEFKNSSEVLLEIINDSHKHLELTVFEKDILNVQKEQLIVFKIPESSSKNYDANVHLVGKTIDENRTVKVHGHLNKEQGSFLVGMFVEAEIITSSVEKYALPLSAVLEEDNNFYVLALKEKDNGTFKFEKISLNIKSRNENWVAVSDSNSSILSKQILLKGAFLPLE